MNRNLWGIALLMVMAVTVCDTAQKDNYIKKQTTHSDEAAANMSTTESAASLIDDSAESEIIADTENLPENLEEGEEAIISYDVTDEAISGSLPDTVVDLDLLKAKNSDVCAYIVIPGTDINSPVLKRDDSNEYYLAHDADDEDDPNGCILMDMGNETDFTDPVTCLYAKSDDGGPFSNLIKYYDPDFMKENELIYVYSDEYVTEYKVFAAYDTEDTERPLVKYNFYDYSEYEQYVREIFEIRDMSAVINKDIQNEALSSWNIITLTGIDTSGSRQIIQAIFNGRVSVQ